MQIESDIPSISGHTTENAKFIVNSFLKNGYYIDGSPIIELADLNQNIYTYPSVKEPLLCAFFPELIVSIHKTVPSPEVQKTLTLRTVNEDNQLAIGADQMIYLFATEVPTTYYLKNVIVNQILLGDGIDPNTNAQLEVFTGLGYVFELKKR